MYIDICAYIHITCGVYVYPYRLEASVSGVGGPRRGGLRRQPRARPSAWPAAAGRALRRGPGGHKDLHSGCRRQAQPGQKRPLEVVVVVEVRGLNARRLGGVSAKALAGFAAGRRSLATVRVTICLCWLPRCSSRRFAAPRGGASTTLQGRETPRTRRPRQQAGSAARPAAAVAWPAA